MLNGLVLLTQDKDIKEFKFSKTFFASKTFSARHARTMLSIVKDPAIYCRSWSGAFILPQI